MKEKIVFLYLNTGGGHRACAKALAKSIEKKADCVLIDCLEQSPRIVRYMVEDGYRISSNNAPKIYEGFYLANKNVYLAKSSTTFMAHLIKPNIIEYLKNHTPTKIVIMHFLLTQPTKEALKELNLDIPTVVAVTDPFTGHPLWFNEKDMQYILFSQRMLHFAQEQGISQNQCKVFPYILREEFSKKPTNKQIEEFKKELGLNKKKKHILLFGGGEGLKGGSTIAKYICKEFSQFEISIICGKNKSLFRQCEKLKTIYPHLHVYGFTDKVYELLATCDIVITKGGPASILEILSMEKIPIITQYIWEQEKGNVEYITHNNLGFYEPKIKAIPKKIKLILDGDEVVKQMHKNIQEEKIVNGTKQTADYILKEL